MTDLFHSHTWQQTYKNPPQEYLNFFLNFKTILPNITVKANKIYLDQKPQSTLYETSVLLYNSPT